MITSVARTTVRQCSRRAQSTLSEAHASASTSTLTSSAENRRPLTALSQQRRSRTAFLRPWDGINSVPEALAVVRGVEKHFGKVVDLQLVRDLDRADVFQPYLRVEFKEELDVPEAGAIVRVKVPLYNQSQTGGPGLLDVRDYLEAKDRTAEDFLNRNPLAMSPDGLAEEEGFKIVDVKVENTRQHIRYTKAEEYKGMGQRRALMLGEAFAKWGGFAPVQEVPSEGTSATSRMTEAQERWKLVLKKSRPTTPSSEPEVSTEVEAHPEDTATEEMVEVQDEQTSAKSEADASSTDTSLSPTSAPTNPPSPTVEVKISDRFRERRPAPQMTKRQRLLVQARELAKQPLPEGYTETPEAKAEKAAQEEEKKQALQDANASLMTKVWKFFGGGQP